MILSTFFYRFTKRFSFFWDDTLPGNPINEDFYNRGLSLLLIPIFQDVIQKIHDLNFLGVRYVEFAEKENS